MQNRSLETSRYATPFDQAMAIVRRRTAALMVGMLVNRSSSGTWAACRTGAARL